MSNKKAGMPIVTLSQIMASFLLGQAQSAVEGWDEEETEGEGGVTQWDITEAETAKVRAAELAARRSFVAKQAQKPVAPPAPPPSSGPQIEVPLDFLDR